MKLQQIGSYAFLLGIIIAIIATFLTPIPLWVPILLIVLGVIVGLLNVTEKEAVPFLVAAIALTVTGSALANLPSDFAAISVLVANIATFVAPAGLIVALVTVWKLAKAE